MNKLSSLLICILLIVGASLANAESFTIDKLTYTIIDESQNLVSVAKKDNNINGTIEVPETVTNNDKTYTITRVGLFESSKITGITLPSTVTQVTGSVFSYCTSLKTVIFRSSNETISFESGVFDGCENLKNVTLPSKLQTLPARTFQNCVSLQNITIPPLLPWWQALLLRDVRVWRP